MRFFILIIVVGSASMASAQTSAPDASPQLQASEQLRPDWQVLRRARARTVIGFTFAAPAIAMSTFGFLRTNDFIFNNVAAWTMGFVGLAAAIVMTAVGISGAVRLRRAPRAPSRSAALDVQAPADLGGSRRRRGFGWSLGFASVGVSLVGWSFGLYECFDEEDCSPSVWPWMMAVGGIVLAPIMFALGIGGTIRARRARRARTSRIRPEGLGFRF